MRYRREESHRIDGFQILNPWKNRPTVASFRVGVHFNFSFPDVAVALLHRAWYSLVKEHAKTRPIGQPTGWSGGGVAMSAERRGTDT